MGTFICEDCNKELDTFDSSPKTNTCDDCFNEQSICNNCGENMSWCNTCQMFTQTCCVDYGTCQCS